MPDDSGFGKNVIIFGDDNSSFVHVANRKKDILTLGKGAMDGLDDATLTAEVEYSINFSEPQQKVCLWKHRIFSVMEQNSINSKKMQINPCPLCLGNIPNTFKCYS